MDEACWNKNENDDLYVRRKCFYSERKCLRVVFSVSRQVAISSRMKLYCNLSVHTNGFRFWIPQNYEYGEKMFKKQHLKNHSH